MQRLKKVAFLTINDIWFDSELYEISNSSIVALHTNDELGKESYNFRLITQTFLLNISEDIDKIFAKFDYKSARYAINKAIREGVVVKKAIEKKELEQYMEFQKTFCKEKGIPVLGEEELENLTCYYAVTKENEYLGGCAFVESSDRKTVRYKYGATLHKLNANEIILWEAIKDYHKAGFSFFDFGGCVYTEDKESYYYRHYHFKKKFGGDLIDSYTYFKFRGIYRMFYYVFELIVKLLFKGDVNGFVNWLNQKGMLK